MVKRFDSRSEGSIFRPSGRPAQAAAAAALGAEEAGRRVRVRRLDPEARKPVVKPWSNRGQTMVKLWSNRG